MVNNSLLWFLDPKSSQFSTTSAALQSALFIFCFYLIIMALAGYTVASDSGRRPLVELWSDVFFFAALPILLIYFTANLLIGLALCAIVWPLYLLARRRVRTLLHYNPPQPLEQVEVMDAEQRTRLLNRARMGGFWFATAFALIALLADIAFAVSGPFPPVLFAWVAVRTILFPILGYFLGALGGRIALRRVLTSETNGGNNSNGRRGNAIRVSKQDQLEHLSQTRVREEARDLVPNDLPLQSKGASRFYLLLLFVFVLLYPALDPVLFGSGTVGRISGYGDLGYYVILALGLNIVVGFAGLLDLGYVAFFVIGTYAWAMVGSQQFTVLTRIAVNPDIWPWFFWPMLIISAVIAALWGVLLGAPTLRLRGDYLAIVTLGFGEIVPLFFLYLDNVTGGTNGLSGIYPPKSPCAPPVLTCIQWSSFNPTPFYYLILALIVICVFANVRLRDSRIGRAWIAIREDEIAASSSGINLVKTKLFAFGAGAFFSGVAGAYHAAKLGSVNPNSFSSNDSIVFLAMVVIGGLGSIPGVIVGAVVVYAINLFILAQLDTIASSPGNILHTIIQVFPNFSFGNIRNLLFGLVLIIIMIFRPEGLIPSARRRRELHKVAEDSSEAGALDVVPGAAGFEEEVHVE